MTRRSFIHSASFVAAASASPSVIASGGSNHDIRAHVLETKTISFPGQAYAGWPTLTRRRNGQLLLVYSGGREGHVCPFGRVEMMVSSDNGNTWAWPRVLLDSDLDDRDAGVVETANGTLLVSTFSSLAYEPVLAQGEQAKSSWPAEKLARWRAARDRLHAEARKKRLGQWLLRSEDGGLTWSSPLPSLAHSPHGPIQLSDGRLLYAGKELWTGEQRTGIAESQDDGKTWSWLATLPVRAGDNPAEYHELHAVETADGRLVLQVRNHNPANEGETLQCESSDGGRTWTVPRAIGVWGLPSHLLRLRDERLVMTYGHRRSPLGNKARVSVDHGRTWSHALTLSADGVNGDLGYPSTVELDDGTLLSVWYEWRREAGRCVLRQARWKLLN